MSYEKVKSEQIATAKKKRKISINFAEILLIIKRCTQTFDSVLAPLSRPALILSTFSRSLYESASSANDKTKFS